MSIIVKAKNRNNYQLIDDKADNFANVQSTALKPFQYENLIEHISLESPNSWDALWQKLAPQDKDVNIDEFKVKAEILKQLKEDRLRIIPKSTANSKLTSSSTGSESNSQSIPAPQALTSVGHEQMTQSPLSTYTQLQGVIINESPAQVSGSSEGAQTSECTVTNGCPISMISGEELLVVEDTQLPGPVPFQWKRTYRSRFNKDIGLGFGWTFAGSERLFFSESALEYYDDEGRCILFKTPQVGQKSLYLPEALSLIRHNEFSFILKKKGQNDKVFTAVSGNSPYYRLTQIRHRHYQPSKSHKDPAKGYAINLHYNSQDQLSWLEGTWGKSLLLTRNEQGRIAKIELSNQLTKSRKTVAEYDYNDEGDLIAHRNARGVGEQYQFKNHLLTQRTLVTGFSYYYEWDGEDHTARCLHNWGDDGIYDYKFEWEPQNKISRATDGRGFTSTYRYNEYGQVIEEIDNEGYSHRFHYQNGRRVESVDPEGNKTQFLYDSECNPIGVRDALGHSEVYSYFKDNLTGYKNKAKARWRYEYNDKNQLVNAFNPFGEATKYTYTASGLVSSITAPGNRRQLFKWKKSGELDSITDPLGHVKKFVYNEWGLLVSSELKLEGDIPVRTTYFEYNETGKLTLVKSPDGKSTEYFYNENDQLIKHIDPDGRITQFEYDGLSQVVRRINPEGHILSYEYDKERNLTALVNENGERYQFFYDGNERLIKEIGFDGRVQEYCYNSAGYLIKYIDSDEVETEFTRDPLGQMVTKLSRSLVNSESPVEKSRFAYDCLGQLIESYNNSHYLAFEYNLMGNLINEHHSRINANKERLQSSYKDIKYKNTWPGIRTKMTLPDGQVINYGYDESLQVAVILHNDTPIFQIERDAIGREVARKQGELTTLSEYDPMGRLQKQHALHRQTRESRITREFGYDQFGNLNKIIDGQVQIRYAYDLLSRLNKVEQIHNGEVHLEEFYFDPAGNLLGEKQSNQARQAAGNRLKMQGDRKFFYDKRGNLILEKRGKEGKLETCYQYNLQNQLVKLEKQGQVTEYNYDSLGRRREKIDELGTTTYLWSGDQMVQEEHNNIQKTYVFEPESFKPAAMVQHDKLYHYHLDHLGTPQELSDEQGNIVWKARYKTYGNVAYKEVEDVENNLRFQGQYFDEESGLHYNRHRYYNPNVGQFITQDPIGLLGGINNYQYAPNPTGWVDPFGLKCVENTWSEFQRNQKSQNTNTQEATTVYKELKRQQYPWPFGYDDFKNIRRMDVGDRFDMMVNNLVANSLERFETKDHIDKIEYGRQRLPIK
ncbi:RHS repeat-associated core domain-containing protein [Aliikangiella sp. G2MR2-5]|uniref:RHS repeat-associated core domain-containing protein n=1 Tax=Aliikangiella sp. G2MR2-5 TaxID=2788943 RepID=UPI0018AA3F52|nr:RHS repeat-associated core domain-containing protein [Aliikangiella sp. G2MR2-5]